MSMLIKKASRKQAKMRIGLFGPSGSGKTYSALLLAKGLVGLWEKIVVVDTENGSADLYSHLGDYSTLTLTAPFDPRRYVEAIKTCEKEGFDCIIIDSISHEWEGQGGCLEIQQKMGGKFEHWAKVTPLHKQFIDGILQSSCHIITTGRSKTEYAFEGKSDYNPKGKVEKIGLKAITREGFDYEMTLAFNINQDHLASIDKDRTTIFKAAIPFMISEETGEILKRWNEQAPIQKDLSWNKKVVDLILDYTQKGSAIDKLDYLKANLDFSTSKDIYVWEDDRCREAIHWIEQVIAEEGKEVGNGKEE